MNFSIGVKDETFIFMNLYGSCKRPEKNAVTLIHGGTRLKFFLILLFWGGFSCEDMAWLIMVSRPVD